MARTIKTPTYSGVTPAQKLAAKNNTITRQPTTTYTPQQASELFGATSGASYSQDKFYTQSKAKFIQDVNQFKTTEAGKNSNLKGRGVSDYQQKQRNALYNLPDEPTHGFDLGTFMNLQAGEFYDPTTGKIKLGTVGGADGASYRGGVKTGTDASNKAYLESGNAQAERDLTPSERKQLDDYNSRNTNNNNNTSNGQTYGVKKVGDTINGQTVVDTDKLGINFNTKTGESDSVKARSGFNINSVKYQTGTNSKGEAIYAYAPTISRQAYNMKQGAMTGAGQETSERTEIGEDGKKHLMVTYKNAAGESVTERKLPSYTKEGQQQKSDMRAYESNGIEKANEISEFEREGKNLYDWMAEGNSVDEWDASEKFMSEKNGVPIEAPDRDDPDYWIELNENSLTGELAQAKRDKDEALQGVQDQIDADVARRIAAIGDVDDATRKAMEDQIRASVSADDKYVQKQEGIDEDYASWRSENKGLIAAKEKAAYLKIQEAAKISAEKAKDEAEQVAQEKKARLELEGLYPDLDLTDEQVTAYAKAQRTQDPAEQAASQKVMKLQAEGKIKTGSEIMDSIGAFKDIAAAKKYWTGIVPAGNLSDQLEKYYTDVLKYPKDEAEVKVKRSDAVDYLIGNTEDIPEGTGEWLMDLQDNNEREFGLIKKMASDEMDAKIRGEEYTWQDRRQTEMTYNAEMNKLQTDEYKKVNPDDEDETTIDKLKKKPGVYNTRIAELKKFGVGTKYKTVSDVLDAVNSIGEDDGSGKLTYSGSMGIIERDPITNTIKLTNDSREILYDMIQNPADYDLVDNTNNADNNQGFSSAYDTNQYETETENTDEQPSFNDWLGN